MISLVVALLLSSNYQCSGEAPRGAYQVPLSIQAKGDNYFLTWGDGTLVGLGVLQGNQLAVSFVDMKSGGLGVILYEIKGGQLFGRWAVGDGKFYQESCMAGPTSKA